LLFHEFLQTQDHWKHFDQAAQRQPVRRAARVF
jgi:hypothetical protein